MSQLTQEEVYRYARHLVIPDVGVSGQEKLKSASVLIVGAGGLGSPLALYLAAAGVGHIGIVDFDAVEASNLQRQIAHSTLTIGQPKVESIRQRCLEINPLIQVDAILDMFTSQNAYRIANGYDILVDGSDNLPTRYLLNDLAALTSRPYVYGSIYRFEGQVSVFDARVGPCYRCLFPVPPPPDSIPTCGQGGVFGVLPGTIGTLQAAEVIKLILGIGDTLKGHLLIYDALDVSFHKIKLQKRSNCPLCGNNPSISTLIDYDAYCGIEQTPTHPTSLYPDIEISTQDLKRYMESPTPPLLIDIRESGEQNISRINGARHIPMSNLLVDLSDEDHGQTIILFCRNGIRSLRAAALLRQAGFDHVYHLRGGINTWVQSCDPQQFLY